MMTDDCIPCLPSEACREALPNKCGDCLDGGQRRGLEELPALMLGILRD